MYALPSFVRSIHSGHQDDHEEDPGPSTKRDSREKVMRISEVILNETSAAQDAVNQACM